MGFYIKKICICIYVNGNEFVPALSLLLYDKKTYGTCPKQALLKNIPLQVLLKSSVCLIALATVSLKYTTAPFVNTSKE